MYKNRLRESVMNHIKQLSTIYVFVLLLLFIGVIFGAIIVNSMSVTQKHELTQYLNQFFGFFTKGQIASKKELFLQSYETNFKHIGMIWLLGISLIGLPIIFILLFIKGIVVGFTVGLLVQQYGIKGFIIALASVLPQNFVMLPVFIYISAIAIYISLHIIRRQLMKKDAIHLKPIVKQYMVSFLFITIIIGICSLFEAYISPYLLDGVLKIVA